MVRWLNSVLIIIAVLFLLGTPADGHPQDQTMQQFYETQVAQAFHAAANPQAANARVRSIWMELARYSKYQFPVLPAQNFTGGQAIPCCIYLDISIAADPSVEITRFFLAHEWGHMMHRDPLTQLSPVGQYKILMGGTAIEDSADVYAATFMRYQNHDIKPVLAFFCTLPDAGPGDTHSSGPVRARNVARIYGLGNADPCTSVESGSSNTSARLQCANDYSTCLNKIVSADMCVANNVRSCTNVCIQSGSCPQGCDASRFQAMCSRLERSSTESCRDKRDRCLRDIDE